MKTTYQTPLLFNGEELLNNQYVTVSDGIITDVTDQCPDLKVEILTGLLCPGFIDTQVNGGGGKLFNNEPTVDSLQSMLSAHVEYGTTDMLPTVITEKLSVMQEAGDAVSEAIAESIAGIVGIHYEGPHLSVPKRGIHPAKHIRSISDKELALFCRQDIGQVLVTLAPENVPVDVIKDLVSNGVHVCLGHSNADAETVELALEAGAKGFTHLFNAMSPLTSREPGMVGVALADSQSYCGLIVDFHHVHATACKLAIKTKSARKMMLVTDAMSHVGSDQVTLEYCNTQIVRQGDKLTVPDGTLAGSALDMASAVRNCHKRLDVSLSHSLRMATSTPAAFLGLSHQIGNISVGCKANMLLLNGNLEVQVSWIEGCKEFCI